MAGFTVVICTRNRPEQVRRALTALMEQGAGDFEVVIVDQSDVPLEAPSDSHVPVRVLHDAGRGLSRSRNLALAAARSDWVVFVDDDCLLDAAFLPDLPRVLADHPGVAFVSPHVAPGVPPSPQHLPAAARPVATETVRSGRWTRPNQIGFGVCMVVRRAVALRLGGWDERLGAGVADFPASDDVDFNYRLLRSGEHCLATPRLRCVHDEWRTPDDSVRLYGGYAAAWAGFAMKHLRTGDAVGGAWLWGVGAWSIGRLAISGVRHNSSVRRRAARAQFLGYLRGSTIALRRAW